MIDEMLTMIPGPTPVHPRILAALSRPTCAHLDPTFVRTFSTALADFRALCRSAFGTPFIVAGGGTLAMEMSVVNSVRPGDRMLVISQGYFGDRFGELAAAFGIGADVVRSEWGRAVDPDEVAALLGTNRYAAVTITHADTSTGTAAPVEDYVGLLRGRKEIVILDGVCATGGIDEPFDEWGVDILLTAPQKAIGAPPGLAMCLFSEKAMARRRSLASVPAFHADVLRWLPVMEDPGRYFSTPCVNQIRAVAEALAIVHEEGLATRFARHRRVARGFRAGLSALELDLFTAPECRADTLSVVVLPPAVGDVAFRAELARRGVTVAGGLGPIKGTTFRLGHMGNIDIGEAAAALQAIEDALIALGSTIPAGTAVAAASLELQRDSR
jgi:aspartate aminotransferase-like enzyme